MMVYKFAADHIGKAQVIFKLIYIKSLIAEPEEGYSERYQRTQEDEDKYLKR